MCEAIQGLINDEIAEGIAKGIVKDEVKVESVHVRQQHRHHPKLHQPVDWEFAHAERYR